MAVLVTYEIDEDGIDRWVSTDGRTFDGLHQARLVYGHWGKNVTHPVRCECVGMVSDWEFDELG